MAELTGRVCSYCGAPLRSVVDGACPFCHVPLAAMGAATTAAPVVVDVVLVDAGNRKIQVIKDVRELTQLGLKEAKDLVEAAARPGGSVVARGLPPDVAARWVEVIGRGGGAAEVRGGQGAPAAALPPAAAGAGTRYDLVLVDVGPKLINVIKAVREGTGLGLKEAKDLVEAARVRPQVIASDLDLPAVERWARSLNSAGASVEGRPASR